MRKAEIDFFTMLGINLKMVEGWNVGCALDLCGCSTNQSFEIFSILGEPTGYYYFDGHIYTKKEFYTSEFDKISWKDVQLSYSNIMHLIYACKTCEDANLLSQLFEIAEIDSDAIRDFYLGELSKRIDELLDEQEEEAKKRYPDLNE